MTEFLQPLATGLTLGSDTAPIALLCLAAMATSALSAIVGMAGGMTLLVLMLLFFDPLVAIPLHGVIQLVSNGSRVVAQREHVRWDIVAPYGILLLPTGFAGLTLARHLPPDSLEATIGVFVLLATWLPRLLLLGSHPERSDPHRRFFLLGGVVGLLNVTVGATGPLIAPFFLDLGLTRFAVIGSKAACQTLGHVAKIAVFGVAGFAFGTHLALLLAMCASVVAGTWLGTRVLHRVNERLFVFLYRGVLTLLALRLALAPLWR